MTDQQLSAQAELYARFMEQAHNFQPSALNPDACTITGPLVNTIFEMSGEPYEASEHAARQFVRDYALNEEGMPA